MNLFIKLIIKPLRSLLKLLFNRIFYVALALVVQLAWLLIALFRLMEYEFREKFGHIEENFYIMSPFSRQSGHIRKKPFVMSHVNVIIGHFTTFTYICPI